MSKCEKCMWGEQCSVEEDEACDYFTPLEENEENEVKESREQFYNDFLQYISREN